MNNVIENQWQTMNMLKDELKNMVNKEELMDSFRRADDEVNQKVSSPVIDKLKLTQAKVETESKVEENAML